MARLTSLPQAQLTGRRWSDSERANVHVVLDAYRALTDGADSSALTALYDEDYRDHASTVPGGDLAALQVLVHSSGPETVIELLQVAADEASVVIHSRGRRSADADWDVIMEIFHVHDGLITEHWEAIEPAGYFAELMKGPAA